MLDFGERKQLDCEKRLLLASKKKNTQKALASVLLEGHARVQFCPPSCLTAETRNAVRAIYKEAKIKQISNNSFQS